MFNTNSIIRSAGSLWFAVVLLVLLMLAMGSATVFESMNGTEQALKFFYHSLWFRILLGGVAVNVLAALVLRYPFSRRQVGFVLTHSGILLALAGALVTARFGIDGQVGIAEGETVNDFGIPRDALTVLNRMDGSRTEVELDASVFGGFEAVEHPETEAMSLGNLQRIEVVRFLPDMIWEQKVLNDNPRINPAVEVSLSSSGGDDTAWLFTDTAARLGSGNATFRLISDPEALSRLLPEQTEGDAPSMGTAKLEIEGTVFELPLEECTDAAVPVGDTGFSLHVLRYIPHAIVGDDNKIINASEQPINPAIEAEIIGPEGSEKRLAFAKFPDFRSMHEGGQNESLKLTFVVPADSVPSAPVEVISGPDGKLYVRFYWSGTRTVSQKIDVGAPVETPWPGKKLTVLRRFDNARTEMSAVQPDPIRKKRVPAMLLKLTAAEEAHEIWLQKHRLRSITIGDTPYELVFGDKAVPLGFEIRLNRFRLGTYPGGQRPRSFESHVTIMDRATGRTQDKIISMNHPAKYGGFTFYQSSYRLESGGTVSFLSVSRDPGQLITFAGYVATIIGMLLVFLTRMQEQRRKKRMQTSATNTGIE